MFPLLLSPRPFADLHVAHIGAVDDQSHGGADFVEPVLSGGAGIDVQQVVNRVVGDFEDVRVSGDEEFRAQGLDLRYGARVVAARVAADVGHQDPDPFAFEREEIGVYAARKAAVDVARYGPQGLERGDGVGQFERPDVARVPDFIDVLEEFPQRAVEGAVRVGYDADLFHLLVFVAPECAHAFGDFRFGRVAGVGFVEFGARQRVGQELLLGEVACEIVGVFVAFAVSRLVH